MNRPQQLIIATATLFLSAGSATAAEEDGVAFASEAKACIAAVNDHVDYDHATRVRHDVAELKNTFSGYVLEIDTRVFTDSDQVAARAYSAHCVAKGDSEPRKFSIEQVTG